MSLILPDSTFHSEPQTGREPLAWKQTLSWYLEPMISIIVMIPLLLLMYQYCIWTQITVLWGDYACVGCRKKFVTYKTKLLSFKLWLLQLDFIFLSVINILGIICKLHRWHWQETKQLEPLIQWILTQDMFQYTKPVIRTLPCSHSPFSPEGGNGKDSSDFHISKPPRRNGASATTSPSLGGISKCFSK